MPEVSGPAWCARFPGSKSPDSLLPDFRSRVLAFISAMQRGGAAVDIAATYRPPERAYLMHWCWRIAGGSSDPADVRPIPGVAIDWTHGGNLQAARAAARAMVETYGLEVEPTLDSRHCHRRAVDMVVSWPGTLAIFDFDGREHRIASAPHDGTNRELAQVGASFGVIKLMGDPPHWSDDGH